VDVGGRAVGIYGSEGWGFESLRACRRNPLPCKGFRLLAGRLDDVWSAFGPHLVRESFTVYVVAGRHVGGEEVSVAVHRHRNRRVTGLHLDRLGVGSRWWCARAGGEVVTASLRRATCRKLPGTISDRCASTMPPSSRSDRRTAADTGKTRASPQSSESVVLHRAHGTWRVRRVRIVLIPLIPHQPRRRGPTTNRRPRTRRKGEISPRRTAPAGHLQRWRGRHPAWTRQ